MSFKDLKLKCDYSSSQLDMIDEFYEPVLSQAIRYDRISGFFDSNSLASVARGLKEFIIKKGKMRLLCGTFLNEDDLKSILCAEDISNLISDNFLKDLESMEDEIKKNHVKLIGWMIANDLLEIKIGIKKSSNGYGGGMLHTKSGILYDKYDNSILFFGSNNETKAGWSKNIEKFKVFKSGEDDKFIKDDIDEFDNYWNNNDDSLEVIDVPQAVKNNLIEISPNTIDEINNLKLKSNNYSHISKDTRTLYPHQEEAINKWFENGKRGILEMATGTGKTFTSLKCIEKLSDVEKNLVTIISCPYAHLVEQWEKDVKSMFGINYKILCASLNSNWRKDLMDMCFKLELGVKNNIILLTTHNSFSSETFINEIKGLKNPTLLIVDEMHHVGAKGFQRGLLDKYDYRLGLSATPSRYMDDEGTNVLLNYFGDIVFKFSIKDGLIKKNYNNQTFLTPYDYFPEKVTLNSRETEDYEDYTERINSLFHKKDKSTDDVRRLEQLYRLRKNIINNAENKYQVLEKILDKYEKIDHMIIFCSDKQIDNVIDILKKNNIGLAHKFTQNEKTTKSKDFNNLSEREFLLKKFDDGLYKVLVAIKCLDEGVDVPSADKVIIISSTNNPREYIQRRGRVLRRFEGKEKAVIHDMVVVPKENIGSIKDNEKKRMMDFILTANNSDYGINLLKKWRMFYET